MMKTTTRYWKDQGIVLKSINFGELDRIITLFTRKKGKIQVVAKGARKVGNRFGPALLVRRKDTGGCQRSQKGWEPFWSGS